MSGNTLFTALTNLTGGLKSVLAGAPTFSLTGEMQVSPTEMTLRNGAQRLESANNCFARGICHECLEQVSFEPTKDDDGRDITFCRHCGEGYVMVRGAIVEIIHPFQSQTRLVYEGKIARSAHVREQEENRRLATLALEYRSRKAA